MFPIAKDGGGKFSPVFVSFESVYKDDVHVYMPTYSHALHDVTSMSTFFITVDLVKGLQDVKGLSESDQKEALKSVIPKVHQLHALFCKFLYFQLFLHRGRMYELRMYAMR